MVLRKQKRHAVVTIIMGTALALVTGTSAIAQESAPFTPHVEGELSVEIGSDHTFKSDDPDNKITDTYPTLGLGVGWLFTPNFSVQGGFTLEPVRDPNPGADRTFEHIGVYVGELYGQFEFGPARLFAGKFTPSFGQAWGLTPGLYGTAFAEDYELSERIGLGGSLSAARTILGDLTLSASLFKKDTTQLSRSIGTDRGQASLADGGAGNTSDLASYSVTLDGANIAVPGGGLAWHLGYSKQAKGETSNDITNETGLVAGLYGSFKPSERASLEWLVEAVRLENAGGGADDVSYLTVGSVITLDERYNLAIAHTSRRVNVAGASDFTDTNTQISVGMEVYNGWTFDVGYKFAKEQGAHSQTIGVLLGKTYAFGNGP